MVARHRACALITAVLLIGFAGAGRAQPAAPPEPVAQQLQELRDAQQGLEQRLDELAKAIDDVAWFQRVGDVAIVDKWRIASVPPASPRNPTGLGAGNPVKLYTYSFVPKERKRGDTLPMLILPHGGVHADFTTYHAHIVRELMAQGYVVIAPDYRGSTGYGRDFYELIDYGGREVDDIQASKDWAVKNFDFVDPNRVGLIGWSHGGLIVLMAAFDHPKDYACVFAGNPVSDLIQRMGYQGKSYEDEFSAKYHIGKTVNQDIAEYKKRSPVWNVEKLAIPLLIHTTTNDEDVNVIEVEHLIQALKAAGKKFEYKVYQDAAGGHSFDRMDTALAQAARREIYQFLARYLSPPRSLP